MWMFSIIHLHSHHQVRLCIVSSSFMIYLFSLVYLFDPTQTMKQQMKDKHWTSMKNRPSCVKVTCSQDLT